MHMTVHAQHTVLTWPCAGTAAGTHAGAHAARCRDDTGRTHMARDRPTARAHLHSRGSCRCLARTCHTAAPSPGAGRGTARCGSRRTCAGSPRRSSGRLDKDGRAWACGGDTPALPAPRTGTHGHSRGSRGSRGCTPGRWCPRSLGGSGTSRSPCRAGPGNPGGHRCRLQGTGVRSRACGRSSCSPQAPSSPLLTAAVRVAMVA